MTVDTEGRIYLASRKPSRPGVLVIDPTGKEVAFIKTGEPQHGTAASRRATRATSISASATTRTCSTSPWTRAFTGSG